MSARSDHLQWCKDRALEFVDAGQLPNAFSSFMSDLNKFDEPMYEAELLRTLTIVGFAQCGTADKMRAWINGFS